MMTGPRTDVHRKRRSGSAGVIAIVVILLLVLGGLAYFLSQKNTPTVTMPDLVGKTETAALQKLLSDGIHLKNVDHMHSKVAVGLVISTDPKSGTTLKKGQKVNLTLSLGVQAAPITIRAS